MLDPSKDELVREVRDRLAAMLGFPSAQVQIFFGTDKLEDELCIADAVRKVATEGVTDEGTIVVNAVNIPYDFQKHVVRYGPHPGRTGKGKGKAVLTPRWQAFARLGKVRFPSPSDISINMMPFIIGDPNSIPEEYQQYLPLLETCDAYRSERGRIGYLTIQESLVRKGQSQRRPGLHTEAPGLVLLPGGEGIRVVSSHWGMGDFCGEYDNLKGGIYMASSLSQSCRVWNVQIDNPGEVTGHLGDIEHFRELLEAGSTMDANELFWITDRTPHESLPVKEGMYRQYFRFVTSGVTVWFENHSTKNPLGIRPDPRVTHVISGDKFAIKHCMYCNPTWIGWQCRHCRKTVGSKTD